MFKLLFLCCSWVWLYSDSESPLGRPVGSQGGDSFGRSSSVTISWVGPARELSHGCPLPLNNVWKEGSGQWTVFFFFFFTSIRLSMHQMISERMIHCHLPGCPLVCSYLIFLSHIIPPWLPLSPFPRQHLHLLLYPFRKMFALFYWWLRGI